MTDDIDRTLEVKLGNVPGTSFRVRYLDELGQLRRVEGNVHEGTIRSGWKKIAVLAHNERLGTRLWLLEATGDVVQEVAVSPFYVRDVRGLFSETHINNPRRAREAWAAFEAE